MEIRNCHIVISDTPKELLSNELNKDKLDVILGIFYNLKDKINNKLIIDFCFEINEEKEIPDKISFYQYYLLSFYNFLNIYFIQHQFILIRFPQIFQNNNDTSLINFDYQIKLNLLNNRVFINNKEFTFPLNKVNKNNNQLLSTFSKILSQIDQNQLLHNFNLFKYDFT